MAKIRKESRLTFIEQTVFGRGAKALYKCSCGVIKEIRIANVKHGATYSCGCLKKEQDLIHGLHKHPLYVIWIGIKTRCYRLSAINYPDYGAKGVIMCDEWLHNPEKFIKWALDNGWVRGLEIDKDIIAAQIGELANLYSPSRCLVVTSKRNSNATKSNHFIEYKGVTQTLQEWSEQLGIFNETLRHRIKHLGWSIEKSFTTPVMKYEKRK